MQRCGALRRDKGHDQHKRESCVEDQADNGRGHARGCLGAHAAQGEEYPEREECQRDSSRDPVGDEPHEERVDHDEDERGDRENRANVQRLVDDDASVGIGDRNGDARDQQRNGEHAQDGECPMGGGDPTCDRDPVGTHSERCE